MTLGSHQTTIGKSQSWITPKFIIDALGPFDLDPCASDPQPWPCADEQWTEDGLAHQWFGFVWLNPPFHRYQVGQWIDRLARHGHGIALVHARTEAEWFEPIWRHADSIGFLTDRLYFHKPDGTRAEANSGAPAVLAAFGDEATNRLFFSGIKMNHVTEWIRPDNKLESSSAVERLAVNEHVAGSIPASPATGAKCSGSTTVSKTVRAGSIPAASATYSMTRPKL